LFVSIDIKALTGLSNNKLFKTPLGVKYYRADKKRNIKSRRDEIYLVYQPKTQAKINGATIVASLSTINFGVLISSFPQVIFSLGTAPE
jgi:hypothetical protein